jgi:hypothetical protein
MIMKTVKETYAAFLCLALFLSACGSSSASLKDSEIVFPSPGDLIRDSAASIRGSNPFGSDSGSSDTQDDYSSKIEEEMFGSGSVNSSPADSQPKATPQTTITAETKDADFDRYGIPCILEIDGDYPCPAIIEKDMNDITQGNLRVLGYFVKPVSDEVIEFGEKNGIDLNGYEMRVVTTSVGFTYECTAGKNASISPKTYDYYSLDAPENGSSRTDHLDRSYLAYEVDYQGRKQPAYLWINKEWIGDTEYYEYRENAIFFVPAGYDGAVRGYVNPARKEKDLRKYHPEREILLFRLA